MSKTSTVGRRIIGSVGGLLAGGVAIGALSLALYHPHASGDPDWENLEFALVGGLGFLIGATIGATAGATLTQRLSKQRSSFRRALLGAIVGMAGGIPCLLGAIVGTLIGIPCALTLIGILIGPILIVAGAVLGSGWKAKPAGSAGHGLRAEAGATPSNRD